MGLTLAARKADARHKIKLGGLIIKAGLGTADAALLLGVLIEARKSAMDPARAADVERLRAIGRAIFDEEVAARTAAKPTAVP